MLDKKVYLDWKMNGVDAMYNLHKEYGFDFLNNDEAKKLCFNVSMLEPLQQFEFLGAYVEKWDYFLYQHKIDADSYCLCLVEKDREQDFLNIYKETVCKLFTKKKVRKRKVTDLSDKRHLRTDGNIEFCGGYLIRRSYGAGSTRCSVTKLEQECYFTLDSRIDHVYYLESQKLYAVVFLENDIFKLVFSERLEYIDFGNAIDLYAKETCPTNNPTVVEAQGKTYVMQDFKLFELRKKLRQIAVFPRSVVRCSLKLVKHKKKLFVFVTDGLYVVNKFLGRYSTKRLIEDFKEGIFGCFIDEGVFVYPKVNSSMHDFWAKLIFVDPSKSKEEEILIPRMESCYLTKQGSCIFIRRREYFYGSFDDLQVYNYVNKEFFTLKNGNFLSYVKDIHFWDGSCYLEIGETVYKVDDIMAYFERTDLPHSVRREGERDLY